ncbi:tRNA-binding protein [Acinetobacter sp. MD2]|uniref:tRNA-binding protein n=1 Tax=Acinetobacter sp. MD2 TaxID=2600066 RepID=UPI002D1E64FA|nr:tRNA-binding protein [Acinetobacter sp. MD2]MEB3766824.1 tRNA-binding protein [Acinetobacter sp. MD2]
MQTIDWNDFTKVELRVGQIIQVEDFPKARKPAFIVYVDFGTEIGIRKSSAQITQHYTKESLLGKKVIAVVNFPKKQIGPIQSECLITGLHDEDGGVFLCVPDGDVALGTKLL